MAYMSTEQAAKIRGDLKTAFPPKDGWKISVAKDPGGLSINVVFLEGPFQFMEYVPSDDWRSRVQHQPTDPVRPMTDHQINHYHLDSIYPPETAAVLKKASEIVHRDHWDKSDIQTDYFCCAFYVHIAVGQWGRRYFFKERSHA